MHIYIPEIILRRDQKKKSDIYYHRVNNKML